MTFLSRLPLFLLALAMFVFATWLMHGRGNVSSLYDSLARFKGFRSAPTMGSANSAPYAPAVTTFQERK